MKIVVDATEIGEVVSQWRFNRLSIGLVPTMGFFHKGHLSLMEKSLCTTDRTVVSLFVNPRQFGPNEDLDDYPKDHNKDTVLAEELGVDVLFIPKKEVIYPKKYQTNISVQHLSQGLCGESRPGHFDGVATVVSKLFNLVRPDFAMFGEKDYQQLAIIRQLTIDLNFNVKIIGCPIVREPDGLAMSSRNKYLDEQGRKSALCLYKALCYAKAEVERVGQVGSERLIHKILDMINATPHCTADYAAIVDATTLAKTAFAKPGNIVALAVFVKEKVRLIDNIQL